MQTAPTRRSGAAFKLALLWLALLLSLAAASGRGAQAQAPQLIANPFFLDWAEGVPANWALTGGATVRSGLDSYDAVRSGPNQFAIVTGSANGDGISQAGIAVRPGARYDLYAWVRAPGSTAGDGFQVSVLGGEPGGYLDMPAFNTATPDGWHRIQATFVVGPSDTSVQVAFVRSGSSGEPLELWLDDAVLWERLPDSSSGLVGRPARPVVLYGLEQTFERIGDIDAMATFNVFDSYYQTPEFVTRLRSEGKVAAKRVYVPDLAVEELVAHWTEPFRDTMEGRIPQGFDAIIIDEFGDWRDGTTRAVTIAQALQQTRTLFPNRQIYVWGDWTLARGSNHDIVLAALNQYVDVFILEAYAHELLPQYTLPGNLANGINLRERANPAVAGLMRKTIFGLASYQTPNSYTADNSADIDYKTFLDEHFHGIANHPAARQTPGVGLFAYQYTSPDTMDWFAALVRHYVVQGQRGYLDQRPSQSPLGRHASILADHNPGFEVDGGSWFLSGSASYVAYAEVPNIAPYHGAGFSPVPHGSRLVRTVKSQQQENAVRQTIAVEPSTTYVLNAYVHGGISATGVEVDVRDPAPGGSFGASASFTGVGAGEWTKVGVVFTTPSNVSSIEITLTDGPADPGSFTHWDHVELTRKSTFDVFVPTVVADVASLTIDWVTDLPTAGEVTFGGGQTEASSTGISTRHHVVLTGLAAGTRYAFTTTNRATGSAPATHSSPDYAAYTRTESGPVPDASPVPPDVVAPDPPSVLAAVFGEGGVRIDWEDEGFDVVGYDVYRAETADGQLERINTSLVRDSAYIDAAAVPGIRYYYAVRAFDAAGNESAFSNRVESALERSRTILPFVTFD